MANIKTAISLPKEIFDAANQLAEDMKVSRSRLFVLAVQEYLERYRNRQTLEQINRAVEEIGESDEDQEWLARAFRSHKELMERDEW